MGKDGLALNFFLDILTTLKAEKGSAAVTTTIKKSGLDSRLMEFFPPINQQQTEENFAKTFKEKNLGEVVNFRKQYAADQNRNVVYKLIKEAIEDEKTPKEIIIEIRDINDKNNITEQDTLIMIWTCVMSAIEWNKKEDLLQDRALRHLKLQQSLRSFCSTRFKSIAMRT